MYEYKIFRAKDCSLVSMNVMLKEISQEGWEPVQVDTERMEVLAKKFIPKTLNG